MKKACLCAMLLLLWACPLRAADVQNGAGQSLRMPASSAAPVEQEKPDVKTASADPNKSDNPDNINKPEAPVPSAEAAAPLPSLGAEGISAPAVSRDAAKEGQQAFAAGDFARALTLWEEAAKKGDAAAMNGLGLIYERGLGQEPDPGRALYWYAEAARREDVAGMANYGRMLVEGHGSAPEPEEGARWLDIAARNGQAEAQYNLGLLYEYGRGVARDPRAAAAWMSRAASMRLAAALGRLGHYYRLGSGVDKDEARATLLLYGGAMGGDRASMDELEAMAREKGLEKPVSLFGQRLDASTRKAMREALKNSGATAKRIDDAHICDIYEPGALVPGASEMAVCYGRPKDGEQPLAFVKIDYAVGNAKRAEAVLKMIEGRFGKSSGGEGENSRLWNLGRVMVASQYAPAQKQMSLMYMVPRVYYQTVGK